MVRHALVLAGLIAFVWLAYSNSFHAPFLLDNQGIILQDSRIHAATPISLHRILTGQYWQTANSGLYRPLDTLSFLFDYAVLGHGQDPYGYHCLNFLIHAGNIVLVYLLGLAIFGRTLHAAALSALWGLHPVLTESVTNVVGRADLLAAFGVLAALLAYRQVLRTAGARAIAWLAAATLASAMGIFSKESAIVVVAVLAIYDFLYARDASWPRRLAGYSAAAAPCLIYLYVRSQVLAGSSYQATSLTDNPLFGMGFWQARLTALEVIGQYFSLLLWPAHLSWDYSYNALPLVAWEGGVSLIGCIAAAVVALRYWRSQKPLSFGIAFFFAALIPTANLLLLIGTIMAERFLYLPAVGFAILAVWALDALSQRLPGGRRTDIRAAVAILLLALAARTYARNGDWADPQKFWLSAAQSAPGSYKANMAAATAPYLSTDQDFTRSVQFAERAIAILNALPDAQNSATGYRDAGIFYRNMGDRSASQSAEAESWYRKSLEMLLRSVRIELVWDERYRAENAARGKPGLTSVPSTLYLALGRTYLRLGDQARAQGAFERGHALESSPELLEELAKSYRSAGDSRKAAATLVEALAVDPSRTDLIPTVADLYGQADPNGCAVSHEGGGVSLNPDCPLVHSDLCTASRNVIANYLQRGQNYEADSIRKIAEKDLGCTSPGISQ